MQEPPLDLKLPPGFTVGDKVSISDLFQQVIGKFKADYKIVSSEVFINKLQTTGISVIINEYNNGNYAIYLILIITTILLLFVINKLLFGGESRKPPIKVHEVKPEEITPPRDFTIEQLRDFNGVIEKSIYIAMCGDVYDVTQSSDFYGADGPYHCFAGRDASRAMAKLCFDEGELSNSNLSDLGLFERDTLESWISKFKYVKQYPIVGKLSHPVKNRKFRVEDLALCNGTQPVPSDRVHSEILIAVKGKVFDVSYGGVEMYGLDGPYRLFAGIDASRALGKMSFQPADVTSRDLSDLTAEQLHTLDEWEEKFIVKKKYPVVGSLVDGELPISNTAPSQ
jgi:membrane-associated progesterone receptor component